ncbi:hypothetical protein FOCC_FOCC011922 [Frankliniella occidentalis]|nr:hypothetical protein FOCC_FOCC011922 [Frankliniella occidentalis]
MVFVDQYSYVLSFFRLCRHEASLNIDPGELDPAAVRVPEVGEKGELLRIQYGALTTVVIKSMLVARGAKTTGKKAELVGRLVDYELNDDFRVGGEEVVLADPLLVPDLKLFKDIHADSPLPEFSKEDITLYLAQYNKTISKAAAMYSEGYLQFVRFCNQSDVTFIHGKTWAEMSKASQYVSYIKISRDGEVLGCTCECTHGSASGEAHCKHVSVVMLGVQDWKKNGVVITEQTCTQQLQTFHHPRKQFRGTPVRAKDMGSKRLKTNHPSVVATLPAVCEESTEEINDETGEESNEKKTEEGTVVTPETRPMTISEYRTYFRNLIINGGYNMTMPLKHLYMPANPYAVCADHDYAKYTAEDIVLMHLKLTSVTTEEVKDIAKKTVQQSFSAEWYKVRLPRLTASKFYEVLHCQDPVKKAEAIIQLVRFYSRATNHGIKHEKKVIDMYKLENPTAKVTRTGFNIMESHPYIGATPDFLIDDDGIGEVKCPYTTRNHPVGPQYQPYLRYAKDKITVKLKKNHAYYYQVQGQLMVTGRMYCDFIVYTYKDIKTIRILRKENFMALMLLDLTVYFQKYYKKAVLNKYFHHDYEKHWPLIKFMHEF